MEGNAVALADGTNLLPHPLLQTDRGMHLDMF